VQEITTLLDRKFDTLSISERQWLIESSYSWCDCCLSVVHSDLLYWLQTDSYEDSLTAKHLLDKGYRAVCPICFLNTFNLLKGKLE